MTMRVAVEDFCGRDRAASGLRRAGSGAAARLSSVFTVANVKAQAEAANAVEAKKLATQSAETRAFQELVSRLTDPKAGSSIPALPPEEVERLVSDIDVRGEGVSGTSYIATFGVTFSEHATAALLRQHGARPIVDRGPEILIIPVYVEDGVARTTDRNPWRAALAGLDLAHALAPGKVAPTRGDITAPIANAYAANSAASLETLKSQYQTNQILFALAEVEGNGDSLSLKLFGNDAIGPFSLERKFKAKEGVDEAVVQEAARLAFETVQERWKLTRSSPAPAPAAAAEANAGDAAQVPAGGGGLVSLQVTAQYSGLKEWQAIRTRLQGVPGVQNWDLRSVDPRSAEIALDFPGGAERLSGMAAAQGLSIENGPDGLIVRTAR